MLKTPGGVADSGCGDFGTTGQDFNRTTSTHLDYSIDSRHRIVSSVQLSMLRAISILIGNTRPAVSSGWSWPLSTARGVDS